MKIRDVHGFEAYIYEAAYIALKSGCFEGESCFDSKTIGRMSPEFYTEMDMNFDAIVKMAMLRILGAFGIDSGVKCERFIKENDSAQNKQNARYLWNKFLNPQKGEFFKGLTPDELILYHSVNFDISREYGNYLGESFNMDNMSIADIGGSSGGLLTGIADKCGNVSLMVFDTEAACDVGRNISDNIEFVPCDFFAHDFSGLEFDIIILSNILHDWGDREVHSLLKNIRPLLEVCKFLIIHEDILDDEALSPVETVVYGLRLAINEPGGMQRTFRELDMLLGGADCGFEGVKKLQFPPLSACIYAKGRV